MFEFYRRSNFIITDLYMDRKFEPLRDALKADDATARTQVNTTGRDEHVPEAERTI